MRRTLVLYAALLAIGLVALVVLVHVDDTGFAGGALAAIIGGVVGGIVQGRVWYYYEKQRASDAEREQAARIRTMLRLECALNLKLLQEYWGRINSGTVAPHANDDRIRFGLAQRISAAAIPPWSHQVWQSQLPNLPIAYKDTAITRLHYFHSRLEQLSLLRAALLRLDAESSANFQAGLAGTGDIAKASFGMSVKFRLQAPVIVRDFEQIVREVLTPEIRYAIEWRRPLPPHRPPHPPKRR